MYMYWEVPERTDVPSDGNLQRLSQPSEHRVLRGIVNPIKHVFLLDGFSNLTENRFC